VYGELLLGFGMAVFFKRKMALKKFSIAVVMAPYRCEHGFGRTYVALYTGTGYWHA
jgi:hypothetical protein